MNGVHKLFINERYNLGMKNYFSNIICFLLIFSLGCHAEKILNRGNGSEPDSLNIHQAEGLNSHNILRDLYEGLMTLDAKGQPIYGVAESHKVENNVWTFKLRQNSKWSDGKPVVAGDFVRAWQKAIAPETAAPYSFLLKNIRHGEETLQQKLTPDNLVVKAIDDFTLEIRLWQADSAFLEKLTLPVFYPLPEQQNTTRNIISNGAYRLSEWNIQEKIVLEKNPHYYDKDSVYFDKVVYWVTEDQSSELKRFRAGELDITEAIPDNQIDWIRQNLPNELRITPYLGSFFLGLNTKDKYLQNSDLRKALSLAINREILVEKVLKTGQQAAYRIIPQNLSGIPTEDRTNYAERVEQAKLLFEKTGFNKHECEIELLYNSSENQRKVAIAIAAMWRQTLGIQTKLVNQEWKVFVNSRKSGDRQTFRSGWIADYADALNFLELFTSDSHFNFYKYSNENFDTIIEQIKNTDNLSMKQQLTENAENILLHDLPVIPLYYYVSRHLVNTKIAGFEDNVADRHLSKYLHEKED